MKSHTVEQGTNNSLYKGVNMSEWLRGMNHFLCKGCQYVRVVKETTQNLLGYACAGLNPVVDEFLVLS